MPNFFFFLHLLKIKIVVVFVMVTLVYQKKNLYADVIPTCSEIDIIWHYNLCVALSMNGAVCYHGNKNQIRTQMLVCYHGNYKEIGTQMWFDRLSQNHLMKGFNRICINVHCFIKRRYSDKGLIERWKMSRDSSFLCHRYLATEHVFTIAFEGYHGLHFQMLSTWWKDAQGSNPDLPHMELALQRATIVVSLHFDIWEHMILSVTVYGI